MFSKVTKISNVIRAANVADMANIVSLHVRSWRQNYTKSLSKEFLASDEVEKSREKTWEKRLHVENPNQFVAVAEINNEFSGFICVYLNKHDELGTLIDNLHVEPKYHRRKVATFLMLSAARWILKSGSQDSIYLEVYAENKRAQDFYRAIDGNFTTKEPFKVQAVDGGETFSYHIKWASPQILVNSLERIISEINVTYVIRLDEEKQNTLGL